MTRSVRLALVAPLFASALSGIACRSTESLEPPAAPALVAAGPLPITLSSDLRYWSETSRTFGQKTRFRVGTLLERLFPARDGRSFLNPVAAHLESSWDADQGAWRATYTFSLRLQKDGVTHPLEAVGTGSSDGQHGAERAALEDCVARIYDALVELLGGQGG